MPHADYTRFQPVQPYFDLVREALGERVDGRHFFDCVADDVGYEVLYDFPGWPRLIRGKAALMASFERYGQHIVIHAADQLRSHGAEGGSVLVIEYQVHGQVLTSGAAYDNRFCSVISLEARRVRHWRDYMDSLAAWKVLSAPAR